MRTSSKRRSCWPTPLMRTSPGLRFGGDRRRPSRSSDLRHWRNAAFWIRKPRQFPPPPPGTSAMQRVALKTEASPVPCDDQVLDFEEEDQPVGPADISTMRASTDRGRGPSHGLRRGQGPQAKLPKLELRKFSASQWNDNPFGIHSAPSSAKMTVSRIWTSSPT